MFYFAAGGNFQLQHDFAASEETYKAPKNDETASQPQQSLTQPSCSSVIRYCDAPAPLILDVPSLQASGGSTDHENEILPDLPVPHLRVSKQSLAEDMAVRPVLSDILLKVAESVNTSAAVSMEDLLMRLKSASQTHKRPQVSARRSCPVLK